MKLFDVEVVWGGIIGSLAALVWFLITQYLFTPIYPTVASWKVAEFFLIRSVQLLSFFLQILL
jgi:dolichyldiphosphatase